MEPSADPFDAPGDEAEQPASAAPPVVAVVVTHDPGAWFEEALAGLAAQDYPALDVLVVDAGSTADPSQRVAAVLPQAYVRRLDANPGFGAAANDVLQVVEGAGFYAFCHDDVALAPDAIRTMVEEAFRSNAGVVGPKLVMWDEPQRLLQVGMAADKTGALAPLAERGDLDQEQHDAVRDVFCVPGACTLVRADLFSTLGGFDPAIDFLGDDLDLCWRAQVAGARVLVAPAAVARHVEALGDRRPVDDRHLLLTRHGLRSVLTCYGPFHLARVLPQALFLAVAEVLYSLLAGRVAHAGDIVGAWRWNLRQLPEIRANRRRLQALRQVPDSELRRLQVRGSARVSAFLRGQIGRGDDRFRSFTVAGRELAGSLRSGPRRTAVVVWLGILVLFLVGSRHLITRTVPAIGDLPRFPDSPWRLLNEWTSGWRSAGLGSESPAPTAFGLLGVGGLFTFGQTGLLRTLLVVGLLPVGVVGAWRMLRHTGSRQARLAALIVHAAIPVPYNAIARGQWGGLVVWAAAPWVLARLGRAAGLPPFAQPTADARASDRHAADGTHVRAPMGRQVLALGLLVAVVSAVVPFTPAVVLLAAAAVVVGGVLAGQVAGAGRVLAVAIGSVVVAAVLHVPWTFDFLAPGTPWSAFAAPTSAASGLGIGRILRFETGPLGAAPLGYAFLVAAALPLLLGRDWRLAWAVRGWTVALACWALVWSGEQSWFPVGLPAPEVLLGFAAAGLALSAALGLSAFEIDLRGYRFGWRQVASMVAAGAVVLGALPALGASFDGRWKASATGYESLLGFLRDEQADVGAFRVLWIADPVALPLGGWELREGVAYATSDGGTPTVEDRWAGSDDGTTRLLADAVLLAETRGTSRLGRLLAPLGVRYVVVPETEATPGPRRASPPPELTSALDSQLDLVTVDADPVVRVYRNTAWAPTRALLPAGVDLEASDGYLAAAVATDLRAATPVLEEDGHARYDGEIPAGRVYLAASSSGRWQLRVDGRAAEHGKAFGWANAFSGSGGDATLRFRTPVLRYAVLAVQVLLWVAAIGVLRGRPRRPRSIQS